MHKDKLLILAMFAVVIAGVVALSFLGANGSDGSNSNDAPRKPSPAQQFRGISLQLNSPRADTPYEKYIDEIAATGANTVCLSVAGYQENCSSSSIFVESRKVCPDKRVTALIDYAHKKGLRVVIMPILLLENPGDNEWRGKINPKNWDNWWEDYTNFVMHYVWLAAGANAEMFVVGSELISTEDQTDQWRAVIARVRRHYSGLLCYSANWDHYEGIKWWGDLDVIGMTTYYDLTDGKEPTLRRLVEAWKPIKKDILEWRKKIKRPILFTEVAWPNQETCAQYPWDYYRAPDKPDPTAQANCFEAFFRTWSGEKEVAGFLIWEWRNHPKQQIGPKDTSYVPCGKPVMKVIRRYLNAPHLGPTTQPSSRPGTQKAP